MIDYELRRKLNITFPFTKCVQCPLYKGNVSKIKNGFWGVWDDHIDYVFIASRSSGLDYIMDGQYELILQELIEELEIKNFIIIALSLCRASDGDYGGNIFQSIECCSDNFNHILKNVIEINEMMEQPPPKAIMLGKETVMALFPGKVKKSVSLSKMKEMIFVHNAFPGINFHTVINPTSTAHNPDNALLLKADLNQILLKDEKQVVNVDNYVLIETIEQFDSLIEILEDSDFISFDIETSGLKYQIMKKLIEKKVKKQKVITQELEKSMLIGISFSNAEKFGVYLPLFVKAKHFTEERIDYVGSLHKSVEEAFPVTDDSTLDDFFFWFGQNYTEYVREKIKKVLENPEIKKIAHNGKFDYTFLKKWWGIEVKGFEFDTMLASYVANENSPNSLEFQTDIRFSDLIGYKKEVFGKLKLDDQEDENYADIPISRLSIYGAKDADSTFRLKDVFINEWDDEEDYAYAEAKKHKLTNCWVDSRTMFYNFYMPLQARYSEAELHGILFDTEYAESTAKKYEKDMAEIQEKLDQILIFNQIPKLSDPIETRHINLSSPKQKKELFFGHLGWPILKETKTVKDNRKYSKWDREAGLIEVEDASTDQDILKQLLEMFYYDNENGESDTHIEIIELVLEYLKKNKMISTYLRGKKLINRLDENNYLHYVMKLHGTVSGRLSSTPNVQNLPKKTPEIKMPTGTIKEAMNVRGIFIAPNDYKLFSADLSQAELRIMADYAEDPVMLDYIERGEDIHWKATLDIFYHGKNLVYDAKDPIMKRYRKLIKLLNFGGLYGGSDQKKVQSVNEKLELGEEKINLRLAKQHSEWFWSEFSRTKQYLDEMEAHILTYAWIDNKFGRRRRLPNAKSTNKFLKQEAVRQGINAQIQGTASDIAQCGYMKVYDWLKENDLKSKILWSVHDEVDGYVHESEIDLLTEWVPKLMVQKDNIYLPLDRIKVKLESEFEIYKNRWGD